MMNKIRLIAVDMDGTLLNHEGKLTERTIKAAQAAMEKGAKFVLSSGRMPAALKAFAGEIGVNAPCVCFNGGAAVDVFTDEVFYQTPVPIELAKDIAETAESMGLYIHAFINGGYIAPEYNEKTAQYERLTTVKATVVNGKVSENLTEAPMKVLILDTPEGVEKVLSGLQEKFKGRAAIMRSQKHLIECVDKNTSKAGALEHLIHMLGIQKEETIAFGDGQNDLEMLKWAGESYVMDNASDAVKNACERFRIAPSNKEDGVAQVIEHMIKEGRIGE
ncbi:MAG: HAD family phosphatase [Clostridia bacterium]|nr:HAD family phosphatase [Clostridia bacterium]MBQ2433362.1 HAD family phosphatase [Clostridia bacterium]